MRCTFYTRNGISTVLLCTVHKPVYLYDAKGTCFSFSFYITPARSAVAAPSNAPTAKTCRWSSRQCNVLRRFAHLRLEAVSKSSSWLLMSEIFFFFFFLGLLLKLALLLVSFLTASEKLSVPVERSFCRQRVRASLCKRFRVVPRIVFVAGACLGVLPCSRQKNRRANHRFIQSRRHRAYGRTHFDSDATAHSRSPSFRYLESKSNTAP